jgi:NAD+ kinase
MRKVAITANRNKARADDVARSLVRLLGGAGATVRLPLDLANDIERPELGVAVQQLADGCDVLFVLGGDGTLLGAARDYAHTGVPLLGINIGHLGFLTEAEPSDLQLTVDRVLRGEFHLERRMMVSCVVARGDETVHRSVALNDIGIGKGALARMIDLSVYVNDELFDSFSGDGVIVSTPTGSTAYSLSCGGPLLVPNMRGMLVTPICAHQLNSRPCVIGDDQQVRIAVSATHCDMGLTVDGQVGFELLTGDQITICKSDQETVLMRFCERPFFSILRDKLGRA